MINKNSNNNKKDYVNLSIKKTKQVTDDLSGQRCDQIAAQLFNEFSRGKIQQWIRSGELSVNNKLCKAKQKLFSGDVITISASDKIINHWIAEPGELDIIFEDKHILILNKPSNCVVHPAAGINSGTLMNNILHHSPQNSSLSRAGIVHRLDKDTTGLMMVAKTNEAHASLVNQLQSRSVSRKYIGITRGTFISGGKIDLPIGRHPTARIKMAVIDTPSNKGAKHAITHYRISEKFSNHTELIISLETGRTHQIRVHLAHIKKPLIGDKTYNSRYKSIAGISEELDVKLREFPRQALHAFSLSFNHPVNKRLCEFHCEAPDDYKGLIKLLRKEDPFND